MTTHILVATDHFGAASGLWGRLIHCEESELVGVAGDGHAALQVLLAVQPDILLLDLDIPGMGAVQLLEEINRSLPDCRVLVLADCPTDERVLPMLALGAAGYLTKDDDPDAVRAAIRAVNNGQMWVSQELFSEVISSTQSAAIVLAETLTAREQEVLAQVAQGRSNVEIAGALSIVERTVEFHVTNLLTKLDVRSRVELAVWATERNII